MDFQLFTALASIVGASIASSILAVGSFTLLNQVGSELFAKPIVPSLPYKYMGDDIQRERFRFQKYPRKIFIAYSATMGSIFILFTLYVFVIKEKDGFIAPISGNLSNYILAISEFIHKILLPGIIALYLSYVIFIVYSVFRFYTIVWSYRCKE